MPQFGALRYLSLEKDLDNASNGCIAMGALLLPIAIQKLIKVRASPLVSGSLLFGDSDSNQSYRLSYRQSYRAAKTGV